MPNAVPPWYTGINPVGIMVRLASVKLTPIVATALSGYLPLDLKHEFREDFTRCGVGV